MKKLIVIMTVIALLLPSSLYLTAADTDPVVYLDAKGVDLTVKDFVIPVKTVDEIKDTGIFGFSLVVTFDPDVVKVTDVKGASEDSIEGIKEIDNTEGTLTYWFTFGNKAFESSSDKTLANISFSRKTIGVAEIAISDDSEFYGADGEDGMSHPITVDLENSDHPGWVELAIGKVSKPSIEASTITSSSPITVRLTTSDEDAELYYTFSSSGTPDKLYEGSFKVSQAVTTVRAVAKINGVYSAVAVRTFYVNSNTSNSNNNTPVGIPSETSAVISASAGFSDITGHWAAQYVTALSDKGIVSGYEDGTFKPDNPITRAEAAKLIVAALGLSPTSEPHLTFADSGAIADWAKGYIQTAVDKGILRGYEDNSFGADRYVTRNEFVVMAARAFAFEPGGDELPFADKDAIQSWAVPSITAVVARGIVSGYEDNTFRPENPVTRAEASKMLIGCLQQ